EEDREDETGPVEVKMADGGPPLRGIAQRIPPGDPNVDCPHREADDGGRAVTRDGGMAELPFGVVEEEEDERGAKARDAEGDHYQRSRADQVDVQPAQDH